MVVEFFHQKSVADSITEREKSLKDISDEQLQEIDVNAMASFQIIEHRDIGCKPGTFKH